MQMQVLETPAVPGIMPAVAELLAGLGVWEKGSGLWLFIKGHRTSSR